MAARGQLVTAAIVFLQDVPRFVDALMSLVAAGDVSFQQNCRDVARADSLLGLRQRVQEKLRGRNAAGARKHRVLDLAQPHDVVTALSAANIRAHYAKKKTRKSRRHRRRGDK